MDPKTIDEQVNELGDQYDYISRMLENGFVFPVWSKQTHYMFPPNVRKAIFTTLCIWKLRKTESYLGMLPRDLIPMLMGFIATRSKVISSPCSSLFLIFVPPLLSKTRGNGQRSVIGFTARNFCVVVHMPIPTIWCRRKLNKQSKKVVAPRAFLESA